VSVSVTTITRNCVHRFHQTWFVGEGSDHLQLIKFWPSCAPGKGVCGGAKFLAPRLLRPARNVCVSSSAFFIMLFVFLLPLMLVNKDYQQNASGDYITIVLSWQREEDLSHGAGRHESCLVVGHGLSASDQLCTRTVLHHHHAANMLV